MPTTRGNMDQSDSGVVSSEHLLPDPLPDEPWTIFKRWFDRAHAEKVQPNPNAMTLATVDDRGRPAARVVLCKGMDLASGHLVFYTNYRGRKGRELDARPVGAAVFHWDDLDKQARIEGPVSRSPAAESDAYFRSRPWISRVGAWASDQSEPVSGRPEMVAKLHATLRRFGLDPSNLPGPADEVEIPRPPHWGGYRLYAERVELWCAGEGRLHDRAVWARGLKAAPGGEGPAFASAGAWRATRIQP